LITLVLLIAILSSESGDAVAELEQGNNDRPRSDFTGTPNGCFKKEDTITLLNIEQFSKFFQRKILDSKFKIK